MLILRYIIWRIREGEEGLEFDRIYQYALQHNSEFAEKKEYYFGIFFEGYRACAMTVRKWLDDLKR